jgi:hypothetical protein
MEIGIGEAGQVIYRRGAQGVRRMVSLWLVCVYVFLSFSM